MNTHEGLEFVTKWARMVATGQVDAAPAMSVVRHQHSHAASPALEPNLSDSARLSLKFNAAREIRQRRIRAGLTQGEFAVRLDMTVAAIIAVEVGEADILQTLHICERVRSVI